MKWFLLVMIIADNAENVQQIGPFLTEAACDEAKDLVNSFNREGWGDNFAAECFYNGYRQEQEKMWRK